MIQSTLVKSNDFVIEVQEDLINGVVTCFIHHRVFPGSDVYDYVIPRGGQPMLQAKADRTQKTIEGQLMKIPKSNNRKN